MVKSILQKESEKSILMMSPELEDRIDSLLSLKSSQSLSKEKIEAKLFSEIPSDDFIHLEFLEIELNEKKFSLLGLVSRDNLKEILECDGFVRAEIISNNKTVYTRDALDEGFQTKKIISTNQGLLLFITSTLVDI